MEKFLVKERVQDRAIKDSWTDQIRVKDPCTGQTLVVIKNPKVKIQPYKSMDGIVDIN